MADEERCCVGGRKVCQPLFRYSPELELLRALLWAGTKAWISWKWEHRGVCEALLIGTGKTSDKQGLLRHRVGNLVSDKGSVIDGRNDGPISPKESHYLYPKESHYPVSPTHLPVCPFRYYPPCFLRPRVSVINTRCTPGDSQAIVCLSDISDATKEFSKNKFS